MLTAAMGVFVILAFFGCSKAPNTGAEADESDQPVAIDQTRLELKLREEAQKTSALQPTASSRIQAPDYEEEARDFVKELAATTDDARREEIIFALSSNDSPTARQTLERLYRTAPFPSARQFVVQSLSSIDTPDLQPALSLLADALTPERPSALRSAAAEALEDLNDPRTLAIWRKLKRDRDPEISAKAKAMIEYLEPLEDRPPGH